MPKPLDPHCASFQRAIDILARPWTALILSLLQSGPLRFSDLEERASGVGAKTLSARLKHLQAHALLTRQVHPGPPIRVSYALTRKGRAFHHVATAIEHWGRDLLRD